MDGARGKKRAASPDNTEETVAKRQRDDTTSPAHPQKQAPKPRLSVASLQRERNRNMLQQLVSSGNLLSKFTPEREIGRGSFGTVYSGWQRGTKRAVAMKQQHLNNKTLKSQLVRELSIMQNLEHCNVIHYIDSYIRKDDLWIVMDYVYGVNVEDICEYNYQEGYRMTWGIVATIMKGVVRGVDYIHGLNIIHRDIKGANILLGTNGDIKLADFGLSTQEGRDLSICGTLPYTAPEVLQSHPYTKSVDIWSLGMLVIEMVNCRQPYSDVSSLDAVREMIINYTIPDVKHSLPYEMKHFINSCLNPNPSKRIVASTLKAHAFTIFYNKPIQELAQAVQDYREQIFEN